MDSDLLNKLPLYSLWPEILLGLTGEKRKVKNSEEILREYGKEKWGSVIKKLEDSPHCKLKEIAIEKYDCDEKKLIIYHGELIEIYGSEIYAKYINLVETVLTKYFPVTALVELGCGFGGVILEIAMRVKYPFTKYYAFEYTGTGQAATKELAKRENIDVSVNYCDFESIPILENSIPEGAIIFTSAATMCVPDLPKSFIDELVSLKPSVVIHFEPIQEHFMEDSLLGLFQTAYLQFNDYNQNLLSLLKESEKSGFLKIISEQKQAFGENPLIPLSIVAWKPV